jgi:hypothetical protein
MTAPSVYSVSATIAAVNTAKSIVIPQGVLGVFDSINEPFVAVYLQNSTTVNFQRGAAGSLAELTARAIVIEFN